MPMPFSTLALYMKKKTKLGRHWTTIWQLLLAILISKRQKMQQQVLQKESELRIQHNNHPSIIALLKKS